MAVNEPVMRKEPDGYIQWILDGKLHRSDGPAAIWADGTQEWILHGLRHRTDGPAMIYPSGRHFWWIQGKNVTDQVDTWMQQRGVMWPWDSATQLEFELTWL